MHNKKNSRKGFTLVEIMIVVVIIGLLAAMAIPAFQKVRQSSQSKTITNNLRQVASAAQQYILENGETQVAYADLVAGGYFSEIQIVNGESYTAITVMATDSVISAEGNDVGVVKYTF